MKLTGDNFCIVRWGGGFQIQLHDTGSTKDGNIAKVLGLSINDYRQILKDNFNGRTEKHTTVDINSIFVTESDIIFFTMEDIQKAITWANAALMMNKMRKKEKNV
jgi:hypothetical protein